MATIVLADDHQFIRYGVRAMLEKEQDFSILGEAGDGLEAAEMVEHLQPDILVIDMVMPSLHGLEVIRRSQSRAEGTRAIVLSMYETEAYVLEALWAGARAYLLKGSASAELVRAIREVVAGNYYLDPHLQGLAIKAYLEKASSVPDLYQTLTIREREVLHLAAEGYTSAQIANRLVISTRTAENYRYSVMQKLGLRNQTDLIRFALRKGILPPEN